MKEELLEKLEKTKDDYEAKVQAIYEELHNAVHRLNEEEEAWYRTIVKAYLKANKQGWNDIYEAFDELGWTRYDIDSFLEDTF